MFAFLQLSTGATLGYLCVAAGFLVILASVVFVIKGKAVLGESGAPNELEWGKMKTHLTSIVALFSLGGAMITLPFWRLQQEEAGQPVTAVLTGKIKGPGDVRLLIVVKPDYDQTYRGDIAWEFPLLGKKASYSLFYVVGDSILYQQPFTIEGAAQGTVPQKIALPELDLQTGNTITPQIAPKLEVSDAELKSLGIR